MDTDTIAIQLPAFPEPGLWLALGPHSDWEAEAVTDNDVADFTPAVVLTKNDAEELLRELGDHFPTLDDIERIREVIRRLIAAREPKPVSGGD